MAPPERFSNLPEYAFPRLRALLSGIQPGGPLVRLTIGEPQHAFPDWVAGVMADNVGELAKYPPNEGTPELLDAISGWIARRHGITVPPAQITALNGTREGLFNAAIALCPETCAGGQPVVLIPNPFYQVYAIAAAAVGAQRAFAQEQEAGALEQLTLYPGPHGALYLGKLLGVLGPLLLVAAFTLPAGLLLFGAAGTGRALPWPALALTTLLGVVGFAAGTTFYSSITVSLRAREALLPALAFPILVPVVIATVRATAALVAGGWSPEVTTWLTFLAAFDVGTIILATLLFPYALEG